MRLTDYANIGARSAGWTVTGAAVVYAGLTMMMVGVGLGQCLLAAIENDRREA